MGRALYRSYRSKSFDEVVGQNHITETLKNSLKSKTFSHAYLFTGPRGVGKTSVARILAHAVNNATYPPKSPEVDIIEIDAASNRRIDEIRELRERIAISPTSLKYKVYIVDEVHMLTREAFNALLKTLEEPPDHAIFILATTDVNKVPDTIVSRCLRFHFRPLNSEEMLPHLKAICENEKIKIDEDALLLIAANSDGSFRDAIATLDQLRNMGGKLNLNTVTKQLGLGSKDLVVSLKSSVANADIKGILELLNTAASEGVRADLLASQLIDSYKRDLVEDSKVPTNEEILELIDSLLQIYGNTAQFELIEVALLKSAVKSQKIIHENEKQSERIIEKSAEISLPTKADRLRPNNVAQEKIEDLVPASTDVVLPGNDELWEKILEVLKKEDSRLYSIARMANIEVIGNKISLKFKFAFHYKRMNSALNKQRLQEVITSVSPSINDLEIILSDESSSDTKATDTTMQNITNIFGSGEVLES